jgi:hypothetical protein
MSLISPSAKMLLLSFRRYSAVYSGKQDTIYHSELCSGGFDYSPRKGNPPAPSCYMNDSRRSNHVTDTDEVQQWLSDISTLPLSHPIQKTQDCVKVGAGKEERERERGRKAQRPV